MTQSIDRDIQEIKNAIDSNTKTIADLVTSVSGLREEMRVGFANVDTKLAKLAGQINNVEAKLEGKIETVNSKLANLESATQKIPDLAEKVGELKNWKQIAIIVFTSSVSGAIAWFLHSSQR